MDDNLLVYGCRLFVPTAFRPTILERLHEAHQGIIRSKDRARLTVYWPGIDHDIETYIADCKLCQDSLPSHPREPIITKPRPAAHSNRWPWISRTMEASTFSWWLIASLTGLTSARWAQTPQLPVPSMCCVVCSATQLLRMLSGPMVDLSSHLPSFRHS